MEIRVRGWIKGLGLAYGKKSTKMKLNDIYKNPIFLIGFQVGEATSYRWKHPPKMKCRKLNVASLKYSAYSFSIKWQVLKVY